MIIVIILFQVHLGKDKDLGSKAQTPPCPALGRHAGSRQSRGLPCLFASSAQRSLSESCPSLLGCSHPKVLRLKRRIHPKTSASSCLPAHCPAISKPPRRRSHEGTPQPGTDQIPTPGIILCYLSLETHNDLHSTHKPLNCPVCHAERL